MIVFSSSAALLPAVRPALFALNWLLIRECVVRLWLLCGDAPAAYGARTYGAVMWQGCDGQLLVSNQVSVGTLRFRHRTTRTEHPIRSCTCTPFGFVGFYTPKPRKAGPGAARGGQKRVPRERRRCALLCRRSDGRPGSPKVRPEFFGRY